MQIPYTGAGVLSSALSMDKVVSKRLFVGAGLPTPPWTYPVTETDTQNLDYPLVLKPRAEGSSIGLAIAHDADEYAAALRDLRDEKQLDLIAEAFVPGHELSVAILGSRSDARVLGTVEIRAADEVYDYEAKYNRDDTEYLIPPPLDDRLLDRLASVALDAHRLLECSGATRADFAGIRQTPSRCF